MKSSSASGGSPRKGPDWLPLIQPFSQSNVPFVKIEEQLGSVIGLLCNYLNSSSVGLVEGSKS